MLKHPPAGVIEVRGGTGFCHVLRHAPPADIILERCYEVTAHVTRLHEPASKVPHVLLLAVGGEVALEVVGEFRAVCGGNLAEVVMRAVLGDRLVTGNVVVCSVAGQIKRASFVVIGVCLKSAK